MKPRLAYFLISSIIILSVFTGIFIWRNKNLKEITKFNEKSFTAPASSKYVPTNADLIFHWKINPTFLPKYIEDYQGKINKKINLIRDSSFKLISLDFTKDISEWAGEHGSFAIFETNKQLLNDWLMVVEIKKDVNIEEKLETIPVKKSINGNINSSNKLIISRSEKINSDQTIYFSKDKDHILISSNPSIIKSSIEQLASSSLSTKEKYKEIKLKDNLNDGILLLEMSPRKIFNLIGQDEGLLGINQTDKLLSSINIDKDDLIFEGIISFNDKYKRPINDLSYDFINTEKEFALFDNLLLIDNPKQYFGNNYSHTYQKLIKSIVQQSTREEHSNLFETILENTKGNLIWLKDKDWLAITKKVDTDKKEISDILKKDKFLNSNLEFDNKDLEIWSKITTNINEKFEIKENIEAIIEENDETYNWSQNLSSILKFEDKGSLANNSFFKQEIDTVNDFNDILRIHLGKEKTEEILNSFYPYILFRMMLGNKTPPPQAIDISIAVPTINYVDFIKFKINLKTS